MRAVHIFHLIARTICDYPRRILGSTLAVVALLAGQIVGIELDAAYIGTGEGASVDHLNAHRAHFSSSESSLAAILEVEEVDDSVIDLITTISESLASQDKLLRVHSITQTSVIASSDGRAIIGPAFGPESPLKMSAQERVALALDSPFIHGRLLSADGRTVLIAADVGAEADDYTVLEPIAARFRSTVESIIGDHSQVKTVHFAGFPFTRTAAIDSTVTDVIWLVPLTGAAFILALLYFLRRPVGAMVAMTYVGAAIVCAAGTIAMLGLPLDQVTLAFPNVLMALSVANAVHLLHRYRHERGCGDDHLEAARTSLTHVGRASLLTSLTTSFGFGSLLLADVRSIHIFGLCLGIGVAFAFVLLLTLLGPCLVLFGERLVSVEARHQPRFKDAVARAVDWAMVPRRAVTITALGFALLGGGLWVLRSADFDFVHVDQIAPNSDTARGNEVLEREFGGFLLFEVALRGDERSLVDPEVLRGVDDLSRWIQDEYDVAGLVEPAMLVRNLNKHFGSGDSIPQNNNAIAQLLLLGESAPDDLLDQLLSADRRRGRMRMSIDDRGAAFMSDMKQPVREYAATVLPGVEVELTGESMIACEALVRAGKTLMFSVLLALALSIVTILVGFRSVGIAIASVLPNLLPIVVVAAAWALAGVHLEPVHGMAFCTALGICVDDTIHLMAEYHHNRSLGLDKPSAIVGSVSTLFGALVGTTVVLVSGFAALMLANTPGMALLGEICALTIGIALVFDLIFIPTALRLLPVGGKGDVAGQAEMRVARS